MARRALKVQPGDLTKFAASGMGLGAPMVLLPYDRLEDLGKRSNFYGFDTPSAYFDNPPDGGEWEGALGLLQVNKRLQKYAAFWAKSENRREERYVQQLRIMSESGLGVFGAKMNEASTPLVAQKLTMDEALWAFIENQQQLYGQTSYPRELAGILGGDGDWAKESLAFGFMLENGNRGIYRIWSRAWLVTK